MSVLDQPPCDDEADIPIAVQCNKHVQRGTFRADIAKDSDLPANLGAKSMQDKGAIIVLRAG